MKKYFFSVILVLLFIIIPGIITSQSSLIREKADIPIPEGYETAWENIIENDEVFYRMMQLERGVKIEDRIVIDVEISDPPIGIVQKDGSVVMIVNIKAGKQYKPIYIIVSTWDDSLSSMIAFEWFPAILFARYIGVTSREIPILFADQLAYEVMAFDVETYKSTGDDIDIGTLVLPSITER